MTTQHQHVHPRHPDMLTVEQALERVLALVDVLPAEERPLLEADGQTLAQDIYAPFDVPGLANSAMDGYAVRAGDVKTASESAPVTLRVIGQVQAGQLPSTAVEAGTALRIMTGAPLPDGADAVVPWELTDEPERRGAPIEAIRIREAATLGDHVRPAGEDTAKGALVLKGGRVLDPPAIGVLATFGYAAAPVIRRPVVGILATGDEVQALGERAEPGRLFDSNSYGVATAIRRWGGVPRLLGIAGDDIDTLRSMLNEGLDTDLLVTSAGVSAGAFDLVKEVLAERGSIDFWSVRMRPSRPLAFGLMQTDGGRKVPHLGLPGNPVSALVALAKFGRPAVAKMMGREPQPLPTVQALLDDPIVNFDGRRVFARVVLERRADGLHAHLTGPQGSNLLTSMAEAHGLAICHEDVKELPAGHTVSVELLDWRDNSDILTIPSAT